MADNYLGKKMEDFLSGKTAAPKRVMNLAKLVAKNRSYRGYDNSFVVRADQLRRIMEVVPMCPSAKNQQVLRLRAVLSDEADKVLPHIRLGGALRELKLPLPGTEPRAFIVICSTVAEDKYVNMDIGIIAQTMLLQATEIGLNGICIGAFDHAAVQQSLNLPYQPLLILAIGKGSESIKLISISEGDSHNYYRQDGVHIVPKLSLTDILL
ncbi:MAG: nitroreductase family protein [Alistipes sp.]|jgi:nitroreductase|nr:nitroreductase family protein [Alistipes sp.]